MTKAKYAALCLFMAWIPIFAQVTAPRTVDPSTLPKPTKDFSVFRDAKTYWIQENPEVDIRQLQGIAIQFENEAGLKPAEARETADVVVDSMLVAGGEEAVFSRPTSGGVVSTKGETRRYYSFFLYHQDTLVYVYGSMWHMTAYPGPDFGKEVAKKIKKAQNKK